MIKSAAPVNITCTSAICYCAPKKQVIMLDGRPFCVASSPKQASKIMSCMEGLANWDILKDDKIKRYFERYLKETGKK